MSAISRTDEFAAMVDTFAWTLDYLEWVTLRPGVRPRVSTRVGLLHRRQRGRDELRPAGKDDELRVGLFICGGSGRAGLGDGIVEVALHPDQLAAPDATWRFLEPHGEWTQVRND